MIRVLASVVALAALLTGAATAPASATSEPRLPRLHATTGTHPGIFDDRGARVLLSSVNVNGLGEYYQANPAFATTIPVRRSDFAEISRRGFNAVRLIVSWSELEPTRGAYDEAYVARVKKAVRQAASYGLYVVIDMHQDAWGLAVDTRSGEVCKPGTFPANGWDGAPAWATITDGAATCRTGERELTPAVMHAWDHFYKDTRGIQTHLVRTWARLAGDVARNPAVAGFDLLNEPGFGAGAVDGTKALGRFYGRTIKAIRRAERRAGGFHHIVFFEPSVLWSAQGQSEVPFGFTKDQNIVFAPHVYAEGISSNSIKSGFASAARMAAAYGVTVWVGEWGFFSTDPADDADKLDRYTDALDRYGYGGAWWSWKQACGDPHVIHQPGGSPDSISPSLIRYSCETGTRAKAPAPAYAEALFRPLARAVPGRIIRMTSDGRAGTFDLQGKRDPNADACSLRVFVPRAWSGKKVRVRGIDELHRKHRQGNVIIRGCVHERFRLRVG